MCITSLNSALCVCCPSSFTSSSSSSPSLSCFAVCLFAQQRRKVLMARAASLINTTCPLSTATSRGSCTLPPPCVIHWITICLEFRVIPLDFLLEKQKINFPARVEVYVMGLSLLSRLSPLSCVSASATARTCDTEIQAEIYIGALPLQDVPRCCCGYFKFNVCRRWLDSFVSRGTGHGARLDTGSFLYEYQQDFIDFAQPFCCNFGQVRGVFKLA